MIYNNQQGFSLIELMIASAISLFILSGLITLFSQHSEANFDNLKMIKLNQEMRNILSMISQEVSQAGYWGKAECGIHESRLSKNLINACGGNGETTNPFQEIIVTPTKITFYYDENHNGTVDIPDEKFGYRLNQGAIERLTSGQWWDLNYPDEIKVTDLQFELKTTQTNISHGKHIAQSLIILNLKAELSHDSSVKRDYTNVIMVKNTATNN